MFERATAAPLPAPRPAPESFSLGSLLLLQLPRLLLLLRLAPRAHPTDPRHNTTSLPSLPLSLSLLIQHFFETQFFPLLFLPPSIPSTKNGKLVGSVGFRDASIHLKENRKDRLEERGE